MLKAGEPAVDTSKEVSMEDDKTIIRCIPGHPDFFKMTAKLSQRLMKPLYKATVESYCFKSVTYYFAQDSDSKVTVWIDSKGHKDSHCADTYIFTVGTHFHFAHVSREGTHHTTFRNLVEDDQTIINQNGVEIMRFCDDISHFIPDVIKTASLFVAFATNPKVPIIHSHVPMEVQKLNVEFIQHATGFQWRERTNVFIDLDSSFVRSGDFFAIVRFDGVDNIIHWGAGSHSGHSVMALWDHEATPPQLYIVESQDAPYWPTTGLQKTKWEDWKQQAKAASFNVAHLPINDKYSAMFNETKAWEWFNKTEGLEYGFKNFLFGWIDTEDSNVPPVGDLDFGFFIFTLAEKIPVLGPQIDNLYKEALNWRLGVKDMDMTQLRVEIAKQKTTFRKVMTIVEEDMHEYSNGWNYVCSSYVASFYKQAGVFDPSWVINPPEFTPRDVYTLKIFDSNAYRPDECVSADPDLPYCQLMGDWKMDLPGWNSIEPYSHMAENCPSMPPLYERPDGC